MARSILSHDNIDPADSDYPYGRIRDKIDGVQEGTPVNEDVYGDVHQFFAKMMAAAGLTHNELPDNDYTGWQFYEALLGSIDNHLLNSTDPIVVGSGGTAPAFGSGFSSPGVGDELYFWKDAFGTVHIEGIFQCNNTLSNLIFTLPVGYRPKANTVVSFILTDIVLLTTPAFGFVYNTGQVVASFSTTNSFSITRVSFIP